MPTRAKPPNPSRINGGQKGLFRSDRKWMIRLAGNSGFRVVSGYTLRTSLPLRRQNPERETLPDVLGDLISKITFLTTIEFVKQFTLFKRGGGIPRLPSGRDRVPSRHNKIKMVQHNRIITVQHNSINKAQRNQIMETR